MEREESKLEQLNRSLYSRNEDLVPKEKRTPVSERSYSVPDSWNDPNFDFSEKNMVHKNSSFFGKFFLASLVFFLLAAGLSAFIFFGGFNMISSNNVDIKVVGPNSVSSGEELDLSLSIVNQNRVDLQNVKLSVDYPTGTKSVGSSATLSHDEFILGTVSKGDVKNQSIRAVLFGQKDSVQNIVLKLQYNVTGSNAVFTKEKDYQVSIGSSPVLLNVTYPQEINSGQDVTLSVNLTSNSAVVVSGTLVKVQYPYGFTYKNSNIKPVRQLTLLDSIATTSVVNTNQQTDLVATSQSGGASVGAVWSLGDLKNGDTKSLSVTGTLVGQDEEDRSFDVSVGVPDSASQLNFSSPLAEQLATIGIRKSFFSLSLSGQYGSGTYGILSQPISLNLGFQNTLPSNVVNNQINVNLSGNVFSPSNVSAGEGGFYSSVDSSILWNKNTTRSLSVITPGDSDKVSFSLTPIFNTTQPVKNPHIDISAVMTGTRTGSDSGSVSSTQNLTFKFLSTLGLSAKSYRAVGSLSNTGPIPPRADQETTYTITWVITNTANDLSDAKVSVVLPVGIVWKGETAPAGEKVSYDPDSRNIIWSVGNVSAGTGFNFSPRTVSFKVSVTPNQTQVGKNIILLPVSNVSATDTYVNASISAAASGVTTGYSDPGFMLGNDIVIK